MPTPFKNVKTEPDADKVFQAAADLFSVLSTPIRLQIISALCYGEQSVSQMLERIESSQPNLSQHLNVLFKSGILAKRKDGTQVIYRVQSQRAMAICRNVVSQIAIEMDEPEAVPENERLMSYSI